MKGETIQGTIDPTLSKFSARFVARKDQALLSRPWYLLACVPVPLGHDGMRSRVE